MKYRVDDNSFQESDQFSRADINHIAETVKQGRLTGPRRPRTSRSRYSDTLILVRRLTSNRTRTRWVHCMVFVVVRGFYGEGGCISPMIRELRR